MARLIPYLRFGLLTLVILFGAIANAQTVPVRPVEKVIIHTDKSLYLAGEIIWFKILVVDDINHRPVRVSKLAYAEIIDRNNKPVAQAKVTLTGEGGNGSFSLPLTIHSDHYILRAYTNWMKNAGSAGFFEKRITIVNTMKVSSPARTGEKAKLNEQSEEIIKTAQPAPSKIIKLGSDKAVYGIRQPAEISVLQIDTLDLEGIYGSVSVYQIDSLQGTPSNFQPVQRKTPMYREQAKWFLPEYNGHFITGRVVNTFTGSVVANARCLLTVPSVPYGLYSATSDDSGIVKFEVRDYYGPGEIIAQVEGPGKNRVDFFSPFSDDPPHLKLPLLELSPGDSDFILQRSISMQAQNIFSADSLRRFMAPELADTLPFFGEAEFTYRLDDYKRFTTMEEVLREYVSPINVLLRNGKLSMSIFDQGAQQVYHENLLVLLDGVPLTDFNKLFSFDPLKIKKLSVVPTRYILGTRQFFGIASFETYDGRFDAFDLDPSLVAVDYEGLQLQREFYTPRYENGTTATRIPDMRSTLYWSTDLSNKFKFYTSDIKGKFIVVLEGVTKNGETVYGTTQFEVK